MVQRVFVTALAQVLRSTALLLLPCGFIALISWATAGSATGNTSDPLRAAIWLFLGAHHIPFDLSLGSDATAGLLSYLPIGALLLPIMAIRRGFLRTLDRQDIGYVADSTVRIIFSIQYTTVITILSFASGSPTVQPKWFFALPIAFVLSYLTTLFASLKVRLAAPLLLALRSLSILLGLAFTLLGVLLFMNLSSMENIVRVLQPGFFGGLLLLALNILYLPNAAIAVISYISGAGIAIGKGTLISPLVYEVGTIPAIPLLAALPHDKSPWLLFGIIIFLIIGLQLSLWSSNFQPEVLWQSFAIIILSIILISYLASGALITVAMGSFGVSIWKTTLAVSLEIGFGIAIATLLNRIRAKRK